MKFLLLLILVYVASAKTAPLLSNFLALFDKHPPAPNTRNTVSGPRIQAKLTGTPGSLGIQRASNEDEVNGEKQNLKPPARLQAVPATKISPYLVVLGCTNPSAPNYNSMATENDGSCIVVGYTNPLATNYDSDATQDDGSCDKDDVRMYGGFCRYGNNEQNFMRSDTKATIDECMAYFREVPTASAFAYTSILTGIGNYCSLYTGGPYTYGEVIPYSAEETICYVPFLTLYTRLGTGTCTGPGGDYVNRIIKHNMLDSSCEAMCSSLPSCAGYTFQQHSAGYCAVHGSMTSAPSGWDYRWSFDTTITGADGCKDGCGYSCYVKDGCAPPEDPPVDEFRPLDYICPDGYIHSSGIGSGASQRMTRQQALTYCIANTCGVVSDTTNQGWKNSYGQESVSVFSAGLITTSPEWKSCKRASYTRLGDGSCTGPGGDAVNRIQSYIESEMPDSACEAMCISLKSECAGYTFKSSSGYCAVHGSMIYAPDGWKYFSSSATAITGTTGTSGYSCYVKDVTSTAQSETKLARMLLNLLEKRE